MADLSITEPKTVAAGMPAVVSTLKHVVSKAGLVRGTRALLMLNQMEGIDCSSCAWPDPDDHRSLSEFCENGAKALAWEADSRRFTADHFRRHSVSDLARMSDYEHGQLGRLVEPMVLKPGGTHYEPISWDNAFSLIAGELRALASPDEAAFYTSGRTSNEAAFLYQLFARMFGTNNLPDCSNMCHESSGKALGQALGLGKGTVTLDDFEKAKLILILGQNPGTNHPRMLTSLQAAKRAGATIVAINPLKEAGLLAFQNPQEFRGLFGLARTQLADHYLQVKIGGDQALLHGVMKSLLLRGAIDETFILEKCDGFAEFKSALATSSWHTIIKQCGIPQAEIEKLAALIAETDRIITCWAMGLTQHPHAVATIQDIVNLHLLRGALAKPGAGLCPVRGHSNVQGDRTMGIWEHRPPWTDALEREFYFSAPQASGFDTVGTIRAMQDGRVKVFFALGGNFLSATPDTVVTAAALQNCTLTAHVSIKLNRSHLTPGRTALILPCLARSERDGEQFVSTENSMGVVQMSRGNLAPASPTLLSEVAIVCKLAQATLQQSQPWAEFTSNYDAIRERIARVVPGFENYNARIRRRGGFYLPNLPRQGEYRTPTGKAQFTANALPDLRIGPHQLVLMTIRTHDQFNTTVYGLEDRYRGLKGDRRVVLMHRADMAERGLAARDLVRIISHFAGRTRSVSGFRVVPYDLPPGNCAAYFPEANVLVPLESVAAVSNTPTSKWIIVTVERETQ